MSCLRIYRGCEIDAIISLEDGFILYSEEQYRPPSEMSKYHGVWPIIRMTPSDMNDISVGKMVKVRYLWNKIDKCWWDVSECDVSLNACLEPLGVKRIVKWWNDLKRSKIDIQTIFYRRIIEWLSSKKEEHLG